MGRSKVSLNPDPSQLLVKDKSSSTSIGTNHAGVRSDPGQATIVPVLQKQQELLRELHDLLTAYAPPWFAEDLHTRLTQALAIVSSTKIRAKQRRFTIKKT
jgi:hypothetical protein